MEATLNNLYEPYLLKLGRSVEIYCSHFPGKRKRERERERDYGVKIDKDVINKKIRRGSQI